MHDSENESYYLISSNKQLIGNFIVEWDKFKKIIQFAVIWILISFVIIVGEYALEKLYKSNSFQVVS